jgi:hypothetical protein
MDVGGSWEMSSEFGAASPECVGGEKAEAERGESR